MPALAPRESEGWDATTVGIGEDGVDVRLSAVLVDEVREATVVLRTTVLVSVGFPVVVTTIDVDTLLAFESGNQGDDFSWVPSEAWIL